MDAAYLPPIETTPRAADARLPQDDRDDNAFDDLVARENDEPLKQVVKARTPARHAPLRQGQPLVAATQTPAAEANVSDDTSVVSTQTVAEEAAPSVNVEKSGTDAGSALTQAQAAPQNTQQPAATLTPASTRAAATQGETGDEIADATIHDAAGKEPALKSAPRAGLDGSQRAGDAARAAALESRPANAATPATPAAPAADAATIPATPATPAGSADATTTLAPELLAQVGAGENLESKGAQASLREGGDSIDALASANPLLARLKAGARAQNKTAPAASDASAAANASPASAPALHRTAPLAASAAPAISDTVSAPAATASAQAGAIEGARAQASSDTTATQQTHQTRTPAPAQQVAQAIVRKFDGGATRFEMRLDPPELGSVTVKLEVQRDRSVTASIGAEDAGALTQLARAARDIADALQSAGLNLSENGLSFDLNAQSGGSSFAQRDETSARGGGEAGPIIEDAPPRMARLESWRGARLDVMA